MTGTAFGAVKPVAGEVVFNTGMAWLHQDPHGPFLSWADSRLHLPLDRQLRCSARTTSEKHRPSIRVGPDPSPRPRGAALRQRLQSPCRHAVTRCVARKRRGPGGHGNRHENTNASLEGARDPWRDGFFPRGDGAIACAQRSGPRRNEERSLRARGATPTCRVLSATVRDMTGCDK